MKGCFRVVWGMIALCGAANSVARAQTAPVPSKPTANHQIRVKNVAPSIIAWWLDPAHNAQPAIFRVVGRPLAPLNEKEGAFRLPAGVEQIVAIDAQNALLVLGTDAGFERVKDLVAFLDRPLRHVEIEAMWVQISPEDVQAKLGIRYLEPNSNKSAPQLGFVRSNFQTAIQALVAQNRAKILSHPRITAINNAQAALNVSNLLPAVLALKDEGNRLTEIFGDPAQIGVGFELLVTPTINNDNTVTLLMSSGLTLQLKGEASGLKLPGLETIVNVHDGDTVALSGFGSALFAPPKADSKGAAPNFLLFVTPRIVHRAADDAVQPVALKR